MNRLARETSPYLRQHAHNPVDWYPWGEEARARARDQDRPILLSIGYSACHWCHVMERESFDDPETARLLNEGFVSVKVDREERPDVDAIYMRAVQALSGRGGWPLTVFLTPEGEPFYGGTYFPPEPRHGMPSFRQLLEATRQAWEDRREDVLSAAERIRGLLVQSNLGPHGGEDADGLELDPALLERVVQTLLRHLDPVHGGFGRAPKFPQPVVLGFLLEHHALTGNQPALDAAVLTLRKMARGGVRDHLGGGFHRYSVDERWLVPHFEKMLYDNALLAGVYLRAFQLTGDEEFESVCREVLDDVLDDFRSSEGGFYTARDADSEGEEGLFYLWVRTEVEAHLAEEDARLFCRCYDVSTAGNFEGKNILHIPHDLDAVARDEGLPREELDERLRASRETLKSQRASREAPLRDEKILASWNALTLRVLAEVGTALDEPRYLAAARTGASWLTKVLRPDGVLLHQVTLGKARIPGFLDDVAGLGNALLSLHEATLDAGWLRAALDLDEEVEARFRDPESDLLFDTPADGETLVIRPREVADSPTPSGTALAAELRLRLGYLLDDEDRIEAARKMVSREAMSMESMPTGFGRLLSVAGRLLADPIEVAVLGRNDDPSRASLLREVHRPFLPARVVTGADPEDLLRTDGADHGDWLQSHMPLLEGRGLVAGRSAAYVCRRFVCEAPATDPEVLAGQLRGAPGTGLD